jgi:serine/threonine protein kinase
LAKAGDRIGPWVVEKALGEGAMGSVYRCHHHEATRMVRAVKILANEAVPQARMRFKREAETLFSLRHPAVVAVVDIALDVDPPYLVMELVEGESLEARLRKLRGLPIDRTCAVFRQIAEGIAFAHAKGIRHRDIKPANIMISDDGVVKIVDFGLAVDEERTRLTEAGVNFGTMSYMPPELFAGKADDDARRDVYSLGVCLYEAIALKRAFPEPQGLRFHETWKKVHETKLKKGPLDPGPRAPEGLRELIRRATHPDPAKRLRDMIEFGSVLDGVQVVAEADQEQAVMLSHRELTNPGLLTGTPRKGAQPPRPSPTPVRRKRTLGTGGRIAPWQLGVLLTFVVLCGIAVGVGVTWLWQH